MNESQCPSREELLAYRCGELPEADAGRLSEHLGSCSACQETLDNFGIFEDTLAARLRRPAEPGPYDAEPERGQVVERLKALATKRVEPTVDSQATPDASPPREDWAGKQLGEYELLEMLGQGGMGAVYKAVHTRLKRTVAVKVLPKERTADERALARFNREMEAVGRLTHANIVQAHDAREIDGTHFLVMEYVEGQDLSELVDHAGPLPIADACEIVRQAALGLQYAHDNGLIHRDIKPSNLMLASPAGPKSSEGTQPMVKILDLGLARLAEEPNADSQMTQAGQVMGTADYIAPEQVLDCHLADAAADQYSLGCTLYKLLTGQAPFSDAKAKRPFETMMAHVQQPVPSITALRPDAPAELVTVIERMLAKKPEERFANVGDVAAALQPFTNNCELSRLAATTDHQGGETPAVRSHASTDDFRSSAMVGTESSIQIKPKPKPQPRRFKWTPKLIALATIPVFLLLCGIVIWVNGTRIEAPDDSRVQITPEGEVHIDTPATRQPESSSGETPSASSAKGTANAGPSLEREGPLGTQVQAQQKVKADASSARSATTSDGDRDYEREMAEWVLARRGLVWISYEPLNDEQGILGYEFAKYAGGNVGKPICNGLGLIDTLSKGDEKCFTASQLPDDDFFIWAAFVTDLECLTCEDARQLARLPSLRALSFGSHGGRGKSLEIDEGALDVLSSVQNLQWLDLSRTAVTDEQLVHLAKMHKLAVLSLEQTKVTDRGMQTVAQVRSLRNLQLGGLRISDEGTRHLAALQHLVSLGLADTLVTETSLECLQELDLKYLDLRGTLISGRGLAALSHFPHLVHLIPPGNPLKDEDLQPLEKLTELEYLCLEKVSITDQALVYLRNMKSTRTLDLNETEITGSGLEHLRGQINLEDLRLERTPLDDSGLEHLVSLPLNRLSIGETKITDVGVGQLCRITALERLGLKDTNVGDVGMEHLSRARNLTHLSLEGTNVTDAGLKHLEFHPRLCDLNLTRTAVTAEGVTNLKTTLPRCEMSVDAEVQTELDRLKQVRP
jgi:serine/threonine protein kinase